jgi:hypothetical protein
MRLGKLRFLAAVFIFLAVYGAAGAKGARGSVIYNFSLPANGAVGAFDVQVTLPGFLPDGGLQVFSLTGPEVTSFNSGTPIDPAASVIGIDIDAGQALFGVSLTNAGVVVLFNVIYPDHFFVFSRTPTEPGSFPSTSGVVTSDFALDTTTPAATLVVTESAVPEPSSLSLLGLGFLVITGVLRLRKHPA